MRLIETGRWLGLVPASVMRFGGNRMQLKVLPVKILSPPAPVGFITVKDRTLTPLAERLSSRQKSQNRMSVARRRGARNVSFWHCKSFGIFKGRADTPNASQHKASSDPFLTFGPMKQAIPEALERACRHFLFTE